MGMFKIVFPIVAISLSVVNVEHGIVTLQSKSGIEYQIEEAEAWRVGDPAKAIVLTRMTQDISDDVIIDIQYTGWGHLND